MTNWYNNYASSYNCNININNYLDILTKNINNQDNNNIENKIHQIEIEYQTKLNGHRFISITGKFFNVLISKCVTCTCFSTVLNMY